MYGVVVTKQFTKSIRDLTKGRKGPPTSWHPGEVDCTFRRSALRPHRESDHGKLPRPPILRRAIRMSRLPPPFGRFAPAVRPTVGLQVTRRPGTGRPSVAEDGRLRRTLPEPAFEVPGSNRAWLGGPTDARENLKKLPRQLGLRNK